MKNLEIDELSNKEWLEMKEKELNESLEEVIKDRGYVYADELYQLLNKVLGLDISTHRRDDYFGFITLTTLEEKNETQSIN